MKSIAIVSLFLILWAGSLAAEDVKVTIHAASFLGSGRF